MLNLELELRTPGRVLMLERNAAQALVDRAFEERQAPRGASILQRAFGAVSRIARARAQDDDDAEGVDRSKMALPSISWAGTIDYGDGYAIVDSVAIIDIAGVLTPDGYYDWWSDCWYGGYAQIEAAIVAARADDRIKAIFMRVDSPGGLADGCFDLADFIRTGNATAGGKPVWASVRMSCSAAYAITAAADRILASAESYVGSIGVLITHYDITGYLAEYGIKVEAIQSGTRKTDGAEWKPLSDDARKHFQSIVDQCARRFVGVVNAGRKIATEDIAAMQAQFYLAQHDDPTVSGLALGLVDEIASERAAFETLQKSLTSSTGGASDRSGPDTTSAATTETDMDVEALVADLRGKAAGGDAKALATLRKMGVPLKAPKADTSDADPDDDEDQEKKGEDGKTPKNDDEDEDTDGEPDAKATGTKAGFALMRHKSAKGREALASRLAEKVSSGKLSYGEAAEMLADAPKASRLAETMNGKDRNPGNDNAGGSEPGAGLSGAVDRLLAKQGRKAV